MRTRIHLLMLLLMLAGCYRERDYEPQKRLVNDLLEITVTEAVIPADSSSTSTIRFALPVEVDSGHLVLRVKASMGTFLESGSSSAVVSLKYSADSLKNIGALTLKSGSKPGVADVQVDYETTVTHRNVEMVRAYPEGITLTAASLSIKPANNAEGEAVITAWLTRKSGVPSKNTLVTINVYDRLYSRELGNFRLQTQYTDQNGAAQSVFVLGDSVVNTGFYQGILNVVGKTTDATGNVLADTIQLFSTK